MKKYKVIQKGNGAIFGEFETRVEAANGRSQNHKDLERLRANLRAILFTNVPGRQKRFTIETPSGDIVMVCYSLERRRFKVGTSFWPTHRPKFLELMEQMYDVESISRMEDCKDAAVITCESMSLTDNECIQKDIREIVENSLA